MSKESLFQKFLNPQPPVTTSQDYLMRLGKRLIPYFPLPQVQEILLDYQEYLSAGMERGLGEASLLETLDAPDKITQALLEESPGQNIYRWKQNGLWMALLALSLLLFRYFCTTGPFPLYVVSFLLFLGMAALSCFGLLHGWKLSSLERQFSRPFSLSCPFLLAQSALPVAVLLVEYGIQKLLHAPAGSIPSHLAGITTGTLCNRILSVLILLCILSAVWSFFKAQKDSIRCYPGVIHALGAFLTFWDMRSVLHSMDLVDRSMMQRAFFLSLLFYLTGLAAALLITVPLGLRRKKTSFPQKEV